MGSTLTRAELAEELYKTIGLSHNESSEIVDTVLEEILLSFEKGENVKLMDRAWTGKLVKLG